MIIFLFYSCTVCIKFPYKIITFSIAIYPSTYQRIITIITIIIFIIIITTCCEVNTHNYCYDSHSNQS